MKCLRCGYCCKWLSVIIVDDPKKGITKENLIYHKGNGKECKHLRRKIPGKYWCVIHNKPYYKKTPCFSHRQIEETPDAPCRMGVFQLEKAKEEKECIGTS